MAHDPGYSTRRSIVLIPADGVSKQQIADAIGCIDGWSVTSSKYNEFAATNGAESIEFKVATGNALQSVNVLPQDAKHDHVPFEKDALFVLAKALESKHSDVVTVSWIIAEKDVIQTNE